MKKLLVSDFLDFLEKLEETKNGEIKFAKPETVMTHLLAEGALKRALTVYLIPDGFGQALMLFPALTPTLFEFIETPNPLIISRIQVAHINRLFLYTKEIFLALED